MADGGDLLLYDGACGLCARSVQWVLEHDPLERPRRRGAPALRFAPLQGETAAPLLVRHGLQPGAQGFDSMVLVRDPGGPGERVLLRSDAAVGIGRYLGGRWAALARLATLVPRALRDGVYGVIARNRLRLFGAADACRVPRRDERGRFLP